MKKLLLALSIFLLNVTAHAGHLAEVSVNTKLVFKKDFVIPANTEALKINGESRAAEIDYNETSCTIGVEPSSHIRTIYADSTFNVTAAGKLWGPLVYYKTEMDYISAVNEMGKGFTLNCPRSLPAQVVLKELQQLLEIKNALPQEF